MINQVFASYDDYMKYLATKKIAVVGLGIGNLDFFKHLVINGLEVTGFDKSNDFADLKEFISSYPKASLVTGSDYLSHLKGFNIIFKTQSMKRDLPEFMEEINRSALLTSEMWEFFKYCNNKIIGITGSSGKTTTTTLVAEMLKRQGYKVWLGGNIGSPLFHKLKEIKKDDIIVLELASCQLQMFGSKSPNISVVTNISPNHLDFHDSYDEYIYSKSLIFKNQKSGDRLVLNYDDQTTKDFLKDTSSQVYMFSGKSKKEDPEFIGAYIKDGHIYTNIDNNINRVLDIKDILIPGSHNVENYMAAILATYGLVEKDAIVKTAKEFGGVEHRIEFVREINNIKFYNDSIGTTPSRTIASVEAFNQKVILITGGYDKNIPYDIMGPLIKDKVKALVLMGQTKNKILQAYKDYGCDIPVFEVDNMEDAVNMAYKAASDYDIVIMSPASASFDMYKNFEEKGNIFKKIVLSL